MRLLICVAFCCGLVFSSEKRVKKSELPAPVAKAMEQASEGYRVAGYSREIENGKTLYEVELKKNGLTTDMTFDPEGRSVMVEEEVPMSALPPNLQDGLKRAAGTGRVVMVESVKENGALRYYEGHVKGAKVKEVKVDSAGNPVK